MRSRDGFWCHQHSGDIGSHGRLSEVHIENRRASEDRALGDSYRKRRKRGKLGNTEEILR